MRVRSPFWNYLPLLLLNVDANVLHYFLNGITSFTLKTSVNYLLPYSISFCICHYIKSPIFLSGLKLVWLGGPGNK